MPTQREKAEHLRGLHKPGKPLVLINVWDAASARVIEQAGFPAIATTSAGIAWLEGFADGERISRECMLQGVARVSKAVSVPVTADLEAGYGPSVDDAMQTARGAIQAGAVGLNFEDWDERGGSLFDLEAQIERIAAIRKAGEQDGVPLVINARTDVFLRDVGDSDEWRVEEAGRRGNRYLQAGADCVFVPGVVDESTIVKLVKVITGPVNVLGGTGAPNVARLGELGVARISLGSGPMGHVLAHLRDAATVVRDTGSLEFTRNRLSHAQTNALFE